VNSGRNPRGEDDRPDERESSVASDRAPRSKHWADRDDEMMDYTTELVWVDEAEDQPDSKGVKLFKIGEKTEKFLTSAFATALPNATRRQQHTFDCPADQQWEPQSGKGPPA